ncbi:cytochrome c oxidase assembly protein [Acuticoccus kandeliae]|uniref:cytochrome c oxidase assembly protein n=1 Tax=Acuticoccus kandeliae TaxID=2073160 RepID=UPI000D3EA772|nr:cytochrome c oxidase assembly protein [Acuticoccus kandeliae]
MNWTYCGPAPLPADLLTRWNFDPPLLAALAVLALVVGRRPAGLAAVGVLFVAFVSPLCALSAALFSARVVHHLLLVAVAAPLLALVWPVARARSVALPLAISSLVLWLWHAPALYDVALANVAIYWLMQTTLLASAVWFWRAVFAADRSPADALLAVIAAFAQMGLLGALLTFAPEPLYAIHRLAPLDWGMRPIADQQLGGLIMWVPAALPYAVIGALLARRLWAQFGERTA